MGASGFSRSATFHLAPRGEYLGIKPDNFEFYAALICVAMSGFDLQEPFLIGRKRGVDFLPSWPVLRIKPGKCHSYLQRPTFDKAAWWALAAKPSSRGGMLRRSHLHRRTPECVFFLKSLLPPPTAAQLLFMTHDSVAPTPCCEPRRRDLPSLLKGSNR